MTPRAAPPARIDQTSLAYDAHLAIIPDSMEAMITVDGHGTITSWNRAAERLLGYAAGDIVGRPVAVLVPEDRRRADELPRLVELVTAHGRVHDFETDRLTKDGHRIAVSISYNELLDRTGGSLGYCCAMRPLSRAASLTRRLYESEQLAALRAIAEGFAHEIGNPVAGVLGVLQLVARRTQEPDTRERLGTAHKELTRIAHILRELTDFTRQDGESGIIDVNEVVQASLTLARYAHPHTGVAVAFEPDRRIGALVGSRNHLLQVFLHLVMNAYEAIGDTEGRLRVETQPGDGEIAVHFEDSGAGIPATVVDQIFEPFFTTKGSTGLGLFVCRRIVADELGGVIAVTSKPGATRFTVRLPLRRPAPTARPRQTPA